MVKSVRQLRLPKVETKIFRGDPLDIQHCFVAYEKLIEDVTPDSAKRLQYVLQYAAGEVNTLVSLFIRPNNGKL